MRVVDYSQNVMLPRACSDQLFQTRIVYTVYVDWDVSWPRRLFF